MSFTLNATNPSLTLPTNAGFFWALPTRNWQAGTPQWEFGRVTRVVDTSKADRPAVIAFEEGISPGGFENLGLGNRISH